MRRATEIAVFARAPVAGAAKTRLIPALGAQGAADLHAAMVRRALATACAAGPDRVTLWRAGVSDHPFFAECARDFGVALATQPSGDLGARMAAAFAAAPGPLLLVGSDCPMLTPAHLRACAKALAARDAVFLPAEDGGYALVGARRLIAGIFADMPWGSSTVMAETRDRLRRLGLTWAEPATVWDVDEPADLDRLRAFDPSLSPADGSGRPSSAMAQAARRPR